MTAEERLAAFLAHCQLMAQLASAGTIGQRHSREAVSSHARAVIDLDRESLDLELLRRLAQRFGRDAARFVEDLIGAVDE